MGRNFQVGFIPDNSKSYGRISHCTLLHGETGDKTIIIHIFPILNFSEFTGIISTTLDTF